MPKILFQKGHKVNLGKQNMLGHKHTQETKLKMRAARLGKKLSEETKRKIANVQMGRKATVETRKKMSQTWLAKKDKNPNWKGGITSVNNKIRSSLEYRLCREACFKRDNWTCVWCGLRSGVGKKVILHADHIKSFADYPELRFALDNLRTLCIDCHKTTMTYLNRNRWIKR